MAPRPDLPMQKRRTQAERSNDSRRRLIEAAITLLAERGYAGTSLAAIGETAGVSRGLVTHHFGSKDQCIAEVVTSIRESVVDRVQGVERHGIAALENLVRTYLGDDPTMAASARAMYAVIVHAATAGPSVRPAVAENNRALRQMIEVMLSEAIAANEIAGDVDVPKLAIGIAGVMRGVLIEQMIDADVDHLRGTDAAVTLVNRALGR